MTPLTLAATMPPTTIHTSIGVSLFLLAWCSVIFAVMLSRAPISSHAMILLNEADQKNPDYRARWNYRTCPERPGVNLR